jgi:uncharacterized protein YbaP (TraB family)
MLGLGLSLGPVPATSASAKSVAESATPMFWQIEPPPSSGESNVGRLYLLGSIHVGPRAGWQLPQSVLDRFESAKVLVVEVDMRAGTPQEQDNAVPQHGLLPGGESIKNHISPALYKLLGQHLAKSQRSLANINPWQPWMVATMLLTFELEQLGYPTESGIDLDMMARLADDQRIIGLESMVEQLTFLSSMSPANQELMLKNVLLQAADIESYFNELKEAWRTGNETRLEAVLFGELEATPELAPFFERVIYGRNQTMCQRFDELLKAGETLFGVVGAYHLVGTRGIPACLAKRGYRVIRLREPGGAVY